MGVKMLVPFWVPYIRCRTIIGIPKGTRILTTTHIERDHPDLLTGSQ